jgi:hypothetical protein
LIGSLLIAEKSGKTGLLTEEEVEVLDDGRDDDNELHRRAFQ